eukprot:211186-Pyramimonas_sp.AAC.1
MDGWMDGWMAPRGAPIRGRERRPSPASVVRVVGSSIRSDRAVLCGPPGDPPGEPPGHPPGDLAGVTPPPPPLSGAVDWAWAVGAGGGWGSGGHQ